MFGRKHGAKHTIEPHLFKNVCAKFLLRYISYLTKRTLLRIIMRNVMYRCYLILSNYVHIEISCHIIIINYYKKFHIWRVYLYGARMCARFVAINFVAHTARYTYLAHISTPVEISKIVIRTAFGIHTWRRTFF